MIKWFLCYQFFTWKFCAFVPTHWLEDQSYEKNYIIENVSAVVVVVVVVVVIVVVFGEKTEA